LAASPTSFARPTLGQLCLAHALIYESIMRRIEKPWGYELIWAESTRYVGKILHINQGQKLSRQYHNQKEETFLVQSGEMDLEVGQGADQKTIRMKKLDTFHCLPKTIHRMVAVTDVDVVEVSTPELDDVVRLEDVYGREGTSKA
jgi:mannose-6-phosphate isomerase